MKTYVEQKFEESYEVNGKGIDRELYKRIYIDGVKTGIAYIMSTYDEIMDEQMKSECQMQDHWQDVRERAAIAAMQGMLSCGEEAFSYQGITDEIAKAAVDYADSLITELKKKNEIVH